MVKQWLYGSNVCLSSAAGVARGVGSPRVGDGLWAGG